MANSSIYAAFERMWQHVVAAVGGKADANHNHDSKYDAIGAADTALTSANNYTDNAITTWIGDTTVSEQIAEAIDSIPTPEADWNQNTVGANGYIKNRTHWVEQGSQVTLLDNAVECELVDNHATDTYYALLPLSEPMVIGNEYLITYDNIEYSLMAEDDNFGGLYVGDYEGESEEIPFCIYTTDDGEYMLETMVGGTHTLKIQHGEASIYHTLDENFIPETIARKEYVDTKVASLVESAPETLNTLNELAAALGDDPNFATTVSEAIGKRVEKVEGKGLSENDYTTAEKNKLANIEAGANKTVVDSALSASSENPVQNKVVNAAISTLNTLVGDKTVSEQITSAVAQKSQVQIIRWGADD